MRFIRELNSETRKLLLKMNRQSKSPQIRGRAKCIILSYQRFSIKDKKSIFGVSRKTIFNLRRWGDAEMGRWLERDLKKVMHTGAFGEMRRWGDAEMGRWLERDLKKVMHTGPYLVLEIFWLANYSPKENLIEILWKYCGNL